MSEMPFGRMARHAMGDVPTSAGVAVLGALTVPGLACQVAVARRFVAETLGPRPQTETAVLLISEAVTNAVIHTSSASVTVVVMETPHALRFEVVDDGGDTVPAVCDDDELREGRRGVFLVRELSSRCGYHTDSAGLTYWFELCRRGGG